MKKAMTVSSSAAPAFLGKWLFATRRQPRMTTSAIGAKAIGDVSIGLVAKEREQRLSGRLEARAETAVRELTRN